MRFWEKIDKARESVLFTTHHFWDSGDIRDQTLPCACLIGLGAYTDSKQEMIPREMFEAYPWLNNFVRCPPFLDGQNEEIELPVYKAMEFLSYKIESGSVSWPEAYDIIDEWEPASPVESVLSIFKHSLE